MTTAAAPASGPTTSESTPSSSSRQGLHSKKHGSFSCGIAAGLTVTCLLNPWDRALYLSVVNDVPFLARENWIDPYRGLGQTLIQRSVSSGLYFPLEDWCTAQLGNPALGGQAAGALNGVLLNPLALIKYHTWGADDRRSLLRQARQMYRERGPLIFLRGAFSTCCRDGAFGLCFSMRRCLPLADDATATQRLFASIYCAVGGTVASAPFNYVRNMTYATSTHVPLESLDAKKTFWRDTINDLMPDWRTQATWTGYFRDLQAKLRLGWGTARVAVGMALTDQVYLFCSSRSRS